MNECICPGDQLIYRCTIQGSNTGDTLWTGNAFRGCQQNAIFLQHHQFTPTGGPIGSCNNEAIVGRSLGVQGNNYTSQLNVTITPETAGKTIVCAYDPLTGQNITIKFSTRISIVEMHIFAYNYGDIMRLSLPARGTTSHWDSIIL